METSTHSPINYHSLNAAGLLEHLVVGEDPKAFEGLHRRFFPLLYQQAYNMIQCKFQAEEIVSDVFLKIWINKKRLALNTNIQAYLCRSVRNQTIDYIRKNVKHKKVNYPEHFPKVITGSTPEQEFIYKEGHYEISQIINSLPPKGRYIFKLSRDKGLKYQEIAEKLDISIKTVETHMRRALIFIRARLKETDVVMC